MPHTTGPTSTNSTQWQSDSLITVRIAQGVGLVQTFLLSIIKIEIDYLNTDPSQGQILF